MLPRLYEDRSRDRYAFANIGRVLAAKITVDSEPASTGRETAVMAGRTRYWTR